MRWSWYSRWGGVADGAATCKTLGDKRAGSDGWAHGPTTKLSNHQTTKLEKRFRGARALLHKARS